MQKYNALNYPLFAGDGDAELVEAVEDALYAIHDFEPDVLLVAAGAGGYVTDPLASLEYTLDGFTEAATPRSPTPRSSGRRSSMSCTGS